MKRKANKDNVTIDDSTFDIVSVALSRLLDIVESTEIHIAANETREMDTSGVKIEAIRGDISKTLRANGYERAKMILFRLRDVLNEKSSS